MLRDLLNRLFPGLAPPLRPPGAAPEGSFTALCVKCGKCAQVCPYGSLRMAHLDRGIDVGTPYVVPREVPCYLCMKCPPVCPSGALDPAVTGKEQVRMGVAEIDPDKCLPYLGIICRACFERCPIYREAITLRDEMYPEVHPESCVGCGICEHVCIAEEAAITVRPPRATDASATADAAAATDATAAGARP